MILWFHVANGDYSALSHSQLGDSALASRRSRPPSGFPQPEGQAPTYRLSPVGTHLSEVLLKVPELQTLFEFLLVLRPKLIEGSLGFIQLGQEPRKEERQVCCVLGRPAPAT